MAAPSPILFLIEIAGAAALLIWSVRLLRTGVERAYSVQLRRWLRRSADKPVLGMATGAGAALAMQSSTAVAVLVANFAAAGTVAAVPGLAIVVGADFGSALVTQFLVLKQAWLAPLLLLVGVVLFQRSQGRTLRQTGRILIGLALIFVSLDMIRDATEPMRESRALVAAMAYLARDPVTAFAIGAIFAWAVHSSVAAVLLFVTLVAQGILPVPGAVALVLGANLGGAVIAFVLTLGSDVVARRIIVANLVLRGGGAVLLLSALQASGKGLELLGGTPARQVINLHLVFNFGLAVVAFPLLGLLTRATKVLIPEPRPGDAVLHRHSALDITVLDAPERALSCASREILRMGEEVEAMLRPVMGLFSKWDDAVAQAIRNKEQSIDRMNLDTKLYLAKINRGAMDDTMARRSHELATMAANFETAGDAVARSIVDLARRLRDEGKAFSDEGSHELQDFHDRVLANAQLALNVMMTGEVDAARELMAEKDQVRSLEQQLQRSHLARLREAVAEMKRLMREAQC